MKKGIYIFFCWSQSVGGGQTYVNSKVKYLKEIGWEVLVFTPREKKSNDIIWTNLEEYSNLISLYLQFPPEFWPARVRKKVIQWMVSFAKKTTENIIIESPTDFTAEWGELLAKELNAKNFCFLLDERLEEYRAKEFLYFKFERGEVAGIHESSIPKLFGLNVDGTKYKLAATNNGAVQDINSKVVDSIERKDFNIAYLGRDKAYVKNIVTSIYRFATDHADNTFNFIVMGEINSACNIRKPSNVTLINVGFFNPIPRTFFGKIDVVIAGAGCASLSAKEGVLTIVADAKTFKSDGILGIDTDSSLFSTTHNEEFETTLENVLINKKYDSKDIKLADRIDPATSYKKHFEFIESSKQDKIYYDFTANKQKLDLRKRLQYLRDILRFLKK